MFCASKSSAVLASSERLFSRSLVKLSTSLWRGPRGSSSIKEKWLVQDQIFSWAKLTKGGNIFEKRLIENYILENGKDPVTNEDLNLEDLVELKSPRVVRPRPPTLTSIPSLLSVFQNEWDALALETYTLQQALKQTRQELSTALYQHDAAVRVIARLSRERDEARDALARITMNGSGPSNGDTMQVDKQELSSDLVATVEATQEK